LNERKAAQGQWFIRVCLILLILFRAKE
jgi:hypothetical protein